MRPPENSSMVAAACAIATGVRAKIGTTPVPSRIRSLTEAYADQHAQRVAARDLRRVDGVEAEPVGPPHPVERRGRATSRRR